MKKTVELWSQSEAIMSRVGKGILLTTKAHGEVDTMTIGWGTLGIQWGKPIFTVFVRESRHTKALLDKNPEFTINVPLTEDCKEILAFCGTKSGRDVDKVQALGLQLEEPRTISVPGIRQLPLILECKVIYRQDQDPEAIAPENLKRYYPPFFPDGRGDFHTAYYGQVLDCYIIE